MKGDVFKARIVLVSFCLQKFMWRLRAETRRRLALLTGQFLILILCMGYIHYFYQTSVLPDQIIRTHFEEIDCFIVSKKLTFGPHVLSTYRADFLINYEVNGVQYNRWVSGNGLDMSYFHSQNSQEKILTQYEVGQAYMCYYDPQNPELAVLVLRHNWLSTLPLLIPTIIALLMIYYAAMNMAKLWEKSQLKVKIKTRKLSLKNKGKK